MRMVDGDGGCSSQAPSPELAQLLQRFENNVFAILESYHQMATLAPTGNPDWLRLITPFLPQLMELAFAYAEDDK